MADHTPPDEGADTEALEEYAEEVGVDPTPQEVDQYLEHIEEHGQFGDGQVGGPVDPAPI
ncbi:MAG TPA: hypothetical protein VGR21_07860 [Cryptosporangiaceae bacterium]|nr:hypothetical protein [Cryptosporangiaceae bacterium]